MKKAKYILLFLCLITLRECLSQCLLYNEIKSATQSTSYNYALEYKNNYYLVGGGIGDTDETAQNFDFNALIVKTDNCGNKIWEKFYGQEGIDNSIWNIKEHGGYIYVLGGTAENARTGTAFMAKLTTDGEVIWKKNYRTKNNDINSVNFFIDNNKIIAYGNHENMEGFLNMENMHLMVIDTSGFLLKEIEYNRDNGKSTFFKIYKQKWGYVTVSYVETNFKYGQDSILYEKGVLIGSLNDNFEMISLDTIKSNYSTTALSIAYNPQLNKCIFPLASYYSSDSIHSQIAFLDSTGKLEKIIEDPYSPIFEPTNLITYKDGWIANWKGGALVKFDADYNKIDKTPYMRIDSGYFYSSNTIVVSDDRILVVGKCRECNPYDYNPESHYERPTAVMVDSNFKDCGKAHPPKEAPKPFAAIKAFPNPALESIILQITETEATYSIYNSMGMFVSAGSMASSADISLLNMESGMYIIQLKSPQGNYIGNVKFLKK